VFSEIGQGTNGDHAHSLANAGRGWGNVGGER
jgi:hypothetical protein